MEYNDALARIEQIHEQIVDTQRYRGFRWKTTALTGVVAIVVAATQILGIGPLDPWSFVSLWSAAAATCLGLSAADMAARYKKDGTRRRQATMELVSQFMPFIVSAAALTIALVYAGVGTTWLVPLWTYVFGLAILSIKRFFSKEVGYAGYFYIAFGVASVPFLSEAALPWLMGTAFGVGQIFVGLALRKEEA